MWLHCKNINRLSCLGTSSGVPVIACLTGPEKKCETCMSTLTSEGEVNVRRNTSLLVRVNHEDGRVRYN